MRTHPDLLAMHARALTGQGPEWHIFRWEMLPPDSAPVQRVDGAVAPLVTRGKGKGARRAWKRMDRETLRTVYISQADHERWCEEWAAREQKCVECMGSGEVFAGWSASDGVRLAPCRTCKPTPAPESRA